MPRPPKKGNAEQPARYPSRDKVTYTAIPKEYGDILKAMTADSEEYEGRSVAFLTKLAVREFLQRKGRLDDKGRPIPAK
ncbi:hypothetical protein [Urbifossiella limnaea]|uniref:Uncharacterized protein n=1 Tax=Urbifossiella limnaea TaxID=2528023 RepID=A0A517Y3A5_9BACT|nr:hypothetical protein [Urbifossiella limnaea]QDU24198.1 hypothetical protein ETAA1_62120 [Urbifossiella limnaea]